MSEMKKMVSVSGGKSSAYIAANYASDYLVFALVTTNDKTVQLPDVGLRKRVSDKIGREFVGTLEDDLIVQTMFDLEQYLGRAVHWVVGDTFEGVIEKKGGWLPNRVSRYCTTEMKMRPLFRWWREHINEPVEVAIGFRANETSRARRMLDKTNEDGLTMFEDVIGKHPSGKNKWATVAWQKPVFPLIDDNIHRDQIVQFWSDKPVTFAEQNNCVGCFHRSPLMLNLLWQKHPKKMDWFLAREQEGKKGTFRSDVSYNQIKNHKTQLTLMDINGFSDCDSGYCGL